MNFRPSKLKIFVSTILGLFPVIWLMWDDLAPKEQSCLEGFTICAVDHHRGEPEPIKVALLLTAIFLITIVLAYFLGSLIERKKIN